MRNRVTPPGIGVGSMTTRLPQGATKAMTSLSETFFWMDSARNEPPHRTLPASMYRNRSFDATGDDDVRAVRFVVVDDDDDW